MRLRTKIRATGNQYRGAAVARFWRQGRLTQYLYAEYPNQRSFLVKLEGQKTEQTLDSLEGLWKVGRAVALAKAKELVELGFFEERGTRDEPTFWVPFLYRDALHLIQGKADADED